MAEMVDQDTGEIADESGDRKLRHWLNLCRTDPRHTKGFKRPGGFSGTAIRPIWNQYRLTEHFGPCGVGWGTDKPEFTTMEAGGEVLVFCTLKCWYMDDDGKRAELYGVGGDKAMAKRQSGLATDDEAFKKAFTDALGNAFVRIGVSADVHMGLFEDSKYVESLKRQFGGSATAAQEAPTQQPVPPQQRAYTPHQSNGASKVNPAVAQPSDETAAARSALVSIRDAIKAAGSTQQCHAIFDGVLGKWGGDYISVARENEPAIKRNYEADIALIADVSPDSVDDLKSRVRARILALSSADTATAAE